MSRRIFLSLSALLAASLVSLGSGCSSMSSMKNSEIPVQQGERSAGTYTVEMHSTFNKPVLFTGQLTGNKSVQSALEESGAISKYRTMTANLIRKTNSYQPLKMPIMYETKSKTVKLGMDYALHPGDRLIIEPQDNGPLDKVADMLGVR